LEIHMHKKLFLMLTLLVTPLVFANTPPPLGFQSPEHVAIGENVLLQFPDSAPSRDVSLHLQNGLTFSYGEILALSGDFYGVVDAPIALGKTVEEQQQRFVNAFATLATDTKAVAESAKLLALIKKEEKDIQVGIQQGENPTAVYARVNTDYDIEWNCITGGLCAADIPGVSQEVLRKIYVLKQGRYLQLADTDFDHFNIQAWQAYSAGHSVALATAIAANRDHTIATLEKAYAMNAFASHYLSDSFAAGHMRSPRLELYYTVFPATVGSILAGSMHVEDNKQGLVISNRRGDTWKAYGDSYYADERNQKNRALLQEAMQTSADEIYAAFATGKLPTEDKVHDLIPDLEKLSRPDEQHVNLSPLFYWDKDKKVALRRNSLTDVHDYTWTAYWIGWETMLELLSINGIPSSEQAALLAHADTRAGALKKGLITDKDVLKFYQSHKAMLQSV
jgi:hypothetical protein